MAQVQTTTGIEMRYEEQGSGEPLIFIMGTSGSIELWAGFENRFTDAYRVITFDNRGMGGSERGDAEISVRSMAEDVSALMEALDIPKAHIMGWSLGSAVAQELAINHPDQVMSLVLYATWARCDGFQASILSTLRFPYAMRDAEAAGVAGGLAFSPETLDRPDLAEFLAPVMAGSPQTDEQMQVTVEQWDADLVHDTVDRLGEISAPTTVIVGEQDLLTPPWQSKKVADAIPGAEFQLLTGGKTGHGLHIEQPEALAELMSTFLAKQKAEVATS